MREAAREWGNPGLRWTQTVLEYAPLAVGEMQEAWRLRRHLCQLLSTAEQELRAEDVS